MEDDSQKAQSSGSPDKPQAVKSTTLTPKSRNKKVNIPSDGTNQTVEWEAAEYVPHPKGFGWLSGLVLGAAVLLLLALWLGSWTFALLVVVMAVAFWVMALRPPRVLRYKLNREGLEVNGVFYSLNAFRAFGILQDDEIYTILLLPTKRFVPALNVFFDEAHGEAIVDVLGSYLPSQPIEEGWIERLMRYLHF